MTGFTVRDAMTGDAAAIAAIYAYHVLHDTATFDTDPPPAEHWREKIGHIVGQDWPFLVADDGAVAGYAYATQFRDRPAYAHTCENSIYVAADRIGRGIGTALLAELIARATASGFGQMIAVISDETVSVPLHLKAGFREAGRMSRVGFKFGRYIDTVYMQRMLDD